MSMPSFLIACRPSIRRSRLLQIALLGLFWLAGQGIACASGLPLPGGVIGMFIVLGLFAGKMISADSLRLGAQWFLAEMMLFFVPAVPALTTHPEFVGWVGVKILAIILVSTLAVMAVTALTVDFCYRWMLARRVKP